MAAKINRLAQICIRLACSSSSSFIHSTDGSLTSSYRCLNISSALHMRRRRQVIKPVVLKSSGKMTKKQTVVIYNDMTLGELADAVNATEDEIIDIMSNMYTMTSAISNQQIVVSREAVLYVVSSYNLKPVVVERLKVIKDNMESVDILPQPMPPREECQRRAPVITIMGHVDHGKTTLLDSFRKSRIVESEYGGITQHIGAFTVRDGENVLTFIDTPGHAAFANMRQRGANSTDIVVLVVAAEDGVKDQTVESIKYAKAANVPIIVAINKCDKPNADPNRAKESLLEHDIVVEDFHGDVLSVDISALYGTNIHALKEAILLQAEDMDLHSTSKGKVEAVVIESTKIPGLGGACTMIIRRGTLKKSSILVAGTSWAKVRTLTNEFNKTVEDCGPSSPVQISGWKNGLPEPGDIVLEADSSDQARRVTDYRLSKKMDAKFEINSKIVEQRKSEERATHISHRKLLLDRGIRFGSVNRLIIHKEKRFKKHSDDEDEAKLRLMLFSDVEGTLEAIMNVIDSYSSPEVELQLVDFGVGLPVESDIKMASELNAVIYCFNLSIPQSVKALAACLKVDMLVFNVIYRLVENLKQILNNRIRPKSEVKLIGEGEVVKMFLLPAHGDKRQPIAGVKISWGTFEKSCEFHFKRKDRLIYKGPVSSMQHLSNAVSLAMQDEEVGLAVTNFDARFKKQDSVMAFKEVTIIPKIEWNPPGF